MTTLLLEDYGDYQSSLFDNSLSDWEAQQAEQDRQAEEDARRAEEEYQRQLEEMQAQQEAERQAQQAYEEQTARTLAETSTYEQYPDTNGLYGLADQEIANPTPAPQPEEPQPSDLTDFALQDFSQPEAPPQSEQPSDLTDIGLQDLTQRYNGQDYPVLASTGGLSSPFEIGGYDQTPQDVTQPVEVPEPLPPIETPTPEPPPRPESLDTWEPWPPNPEPPLEQPPEPTLPEVTKSPAPDVMPAVTELPSPVTSTAQPETPPEGTPEAATTQDPNKALLWAQQQVGLPYSGPLSRIGGGRFGDPGYDCSSFVAAAFRQLGINLTPFTDAAAGQTQRVDNSQAQPGDIVFYKYADPSQPNVQYPHMGIYLGNGQMIDASYNSGVSVRPLLNLPYEIHRVPGAGTAAAFAAADQAEAAGPPGGQSFGPIDSSSRDAFLRTARPYAEAVAAETGIPAAIMLGIAANETGNGRYAQGNNYFGIKGQNPDTGASFNAATWEVENGQRVNTRDTFRAYDNPAESFRDFARFLADNSRYAGALQQTSNPEAFIRAVQSAGYATDPNWANQVIAIARQSGVPMQGDTFHRPSNQPLAVPSSVPVPGDIPLTSEGVDWSQQRPITGPEAADAWAEHAYQTLGQRPPEQSGGFPDLLGMGYDALLNRTEPARNAIGTGTRGVLDTIGVATEGPRDFLAQPNKPGAIQAPLDLAQLAMDTMQGIGAGPITGAARAGLAEEQIANETRPQYEALQTAIQRYGYDDPRTQEAADAYNQATAASRGSDTGFAAAERNPAYGASELATGLMSAAVGGLLAPTTEVPGLARAASAALNPVETLGLGAEAVGRVAGPALERIAPFARELATSEAAGIRLPSRGEVPPVPEPGPGRSLPNGMRQLDSGLIVPEAATAPRAGGQILSPSEELISTVGAPGSAILRHGEDAMQYLTEMSPELKAQVGNLRRMDVSPDIVATTIRTIEDNPDLVDAARRGIISHEQTLQDAPALGRSVEDFLATPKGQAFNEAEITALRMTTAKTEQDLLSKAQGIMQAGGIDQVDDLTRADFLSSMADAAQLVALERGGKATAGRALGALRMDLSRLMTAAKPTGAEAQDATDSLLGTARRVADTVIDTARQNGIIHAAPGSAEEDLLRARTMGDYIDAHFDPRLVDRARASLSENLSPEPGAPLNSADPLYIRMRSSVAAMERQAERAWEDEYFAQTGKAPSDAWLQNKMANEWASENRGLQTGINTAAERANLGPEERALTPSDQAAQRAFDKRLMQESQGFGAAADEGLFQAEMARLQKESDSLTGQINRLENPRVPTPKTQTPDDLLYEARQGFADRQLRASVQQAKQEWDAGWRRLEQASRVEDQTRQRQMEAATKILSNVAGQGMTRQMLGDFINTVMAGDPMATAQFLRNAGKQDMWGRLNLLRYSGMLSATSTHLNNITSNAVRLGMDIGGKPVATGVDIARAGLTGGERAMFLSEMPSAARGAFEGALAGLRMAGTTLATGISPTQLGKLENVRPGLQSGSRKLDTVMEMPLRMLSAADDVFRSMAFGAHARAMAEREAIQNPVRGMTKEARVQFIMEHLPDFPEIMKAAEQRASEAVFQEKRELPGLLVRAREDLRIPATPIRPLQWAIPFVKTPMNIAAQGLDMAGIGYLRAYEDFKNGRNVEGAENAAKSLIGWTIAAAGIYLGQAGLANGANASTESGRNTQNPGAIPWSVKIGDKDFDIRFLGPLAVPLAAGITIGNIHRGGTFDEKTIPTAVAAMGKYTLDQSSVIGMANFLNAIMQPDRYAEAFAETMVTQPVPFSSAFRQGNRAFGVGPRNPENPWQAIEANLPVLAGQVAPRRDIYGQPVPASPSGIAAFVSPLRFGTEQSDYALSEMARLGVPLGDPGRTFHGVRLNDQQYDQYKQMFGASLQKQLGTVVNRPGYAGQSDRVRSAQLEQAVTTARGQANANVLQLIRPQLQEAARKRAVGAGR